MWAIQGNICKHIINIKTLLWYGWPTCATFDLNTTPIDENDYDFNEQPIVE